MSSGSKTSSWRATRERRGAIVVRLQEQLGNQLLEFAAGYTVARRLDAPLRLDDRYVPSARRLLPHCLGSAWQPARRTDLLRVGELGRSRIGRLPGLAQRRILPAARQRLRAPPHRFVFPFSEAFSFDEQFDRLASPCYLSHLFQHRRYFDETLPDVSELVCASLGLTSRDPAPLPEVGVHFRRGDYVRLGVALPLEYYAAALALVGDRVPRFRVRVFSDDSVFAEAMAGSLADDGFEVARTDPRPVHEIPDLDAFKRLAMCDHVIVANSTFSWWGATLGDHLAAHPARLVVYPGPSLPFPGPVHLAAPTWTAI
jgi:hypothetical protein